MPAIENFRVNLASVMERSGITDYDLNKSTDVSRAYIGKIRHGLVMPSLEYCEKLAVGVKVPLIFLLMEQDQFENFMSRTLDKIELADGKLVEQEILPPEVTRPNPHRTGPKTTKKASSPEAHRRLLWIKKLLAG